jgi:hypothetical protein
MFVQYGFLYLILARPKLTVCPLRLVVIAVVPIFQL